MTTVSACQCSLNECPIGHGTGPCGNLVPRGDLFCGKCGHYFSRLMERLAGD